MNRLSTIFILLLSLSLASCNLESKARKLNQETASAKDESTKDDSDEDDSDENDSDEDDSVEDDSTSTVTLSSPTSLALADGLTSPAYNPTPTIQVTGVSIGDTVTLYLDTSCTSEIGSVTALGETVDITTDSLSGGEHTFYAKRTDDNNGASDCTEGISFTVLTFLPVCDRTEQVRDKIVGKLNAPGLDNKSCEDITLEDLGGIGSLPFWGLGITSLKNGDFSGLTNLTNLEFVSNELTTIEAGIFDELASLEFLLLGYDQISTIETGAFNGLSSLTVLQIQGNQILTIEASLFDGLDSLENLLFDNNQLTALPEGVFDGLSSLQKLELNGNQLVTLPEGAFDELTSLEKLYLNDNKLSPTEVTRITNEVDALSGVTLDISDQEYCPSGYIGVLSNTTVGAPDDFCVMEYEAKDVGGVATSQAAVTPWVSISQTDAWGECDSLNSEPLRADIDSDDNSDGTYALISNPEWMAIARNVEEQDDNWSGGSVGSGCLFRGNNGLDDDCGYDGSDPEFGTGRDTKAKHTLSTSEEIWDIAGNTYEWVDWSIEGELNLGPTSCSTGWQEFPAVSCGALASADYMPSNSSYNSANGMGKFYGGSEGAALRGGVWDDMAGAGVFMLFLNHASLGANTYNGFRCVWRP